jgi:hypothetical protein
MQVLATLTSRNESIVSKFAFDSENMSIPLDITWDGHHASRLLNADTAPGGVVDTLGGSPVTINLHHDGVRVELYTETYASAYGTPKPADVLAAFQATAEAALEVGLGINAGHDLNRDNLHTFLANVPGVQEVSIGHALIADALGLGYTDTIRAFHACMPQA